MNFGFLGAALARAVASSAGKKRAAPAKPPASQPNSALTYSENGRSGYVHYSNEGNKFSMYFEFGGGDAVAVISVPSAEDWEAKTGLQLSQRGEVLDFIARQVIEYKTSTGKNRYEISDRWITIFEA